jgi:uncharacterized membrane protein YwzB
MLGGSLNFEITIKFWFFDKIRIKELSKKICLKNLKELMIFIKELAILWSYFLIKKRE